jgi:hypothetical protein
MCTFCDTEPPWRFREASDGVVGDDIGDGSRRRRAIRPEPLRGPVERAEEGAGRNRGVGSRQFAAPDAGHDQGADGPLVAIPLGDNPRPQLHRQGIDLEVRGGAFDFVDDAADVGGCQRAQAAGQRPAVGSRPRRGGNQAIERAILAEE